MVPSVVVRSGSWELRALSLAVFSPQSRGLATYGWPLVSGLWRTCCPLWSAWISLGFLSGSLRALQVCTYTHTPSFQCNNVFCSMSILISILHHLFPSNICQKVWEGLICYLPLSSCVVDADADYPFPYFFSSMMVLDVGMIIVFLWAPLLLIWDLSKLAMSGLAEFILVSHLVSFQSWFPSILLIYFGFQSWMSCTLGNKMAHSGSSSSFCKVFRIFFPDRISHSLVIWHGV